MLLSGFASIKNFGLGQLSRLRENASLIYIYETITTTLEPVKAKSIPMKKGISKIYL